MSCAIPEWENIYGPEKLICVLDDCQVDYMAEIEEDIDFQRDIAFKFLYSLCGCEYSSNY